MIFFVNLFIVYPFLKVVNAVFLFRFIYADDEWIGGLLANTERYLRERAITYTKELPIFMYPKLISKQFVKML